MAHVVKHGLSAMLGPIEKTFSQACLKVQMARLEGVAFTAEGNQVAGLVGTAEPPRHNMVDVKRRSRALALGTPVPVAPDDQVSRLRRHASRPVKAQALPYGNAHVSRGLLVRRVSRGGGGFLVAAQQRGSRRAHFAEVALATKAERSIRLRERDIAASAESLAMATERGSRGGGWKSAAGSPNGKEKPG